MKSTENLSDILKQMKQKGAQLRRAVANIPAIVLETPFSQLPLAFNKVDLPLTALAKDIVGYFTPTYWNFFLKHAKPGVLTSQASFDIPNEPRGARTPPFTNPAGPGASGIYREDTDESTYSTPMSQLRTTTPTTTRRLPTGPTRHGSFAGIIRKTRKPKGNKTPSRGSVAGIAKRRLFTSGDSQPPVHMATFQPINPSRIVRRHIRVLKSNLLTNGDVRRLARRGGVKRISRDIKFEINKALKDFLRSIVERSVTFCEYAKRKTVTLQDVTMSCKSLGKTLYL
jgi:histone H4